MKELNNHIELLISRKLAGEINPEDEQVLNNWLNSDPEKLAYFQDIEKIYNEAEGHNASKLPSINIDAEWDKFKANRNIANKTNSWKAWYSIAAAIALIASLGYLFWNNSYQSGQVVVLAERTGLAVILPDSSVITLNKGAKLSYPKEFSEEKRQVALTGEAFFEIKRNENKPFSVDLGLSKVEVLGTSFNINNINENNNVEVIVNSGTVRFSNKELSESVILNKGEKGTIMRNNGTIAKTENLDVNFMAWKTRKIVFNNVGLDEVIKTLNKIYDEEITFSTDIGPDCRVTVSFDNQSIEAILSVLEATLNLEYNKTGDNIEVIKSGC
ncbi:MAG: FecR domain-containing protein [Bacteroidota bacterium]